jgi:phosphatidylserine/phosphatidylglycerophosphate/cardiolipin synthase-like enzyme
MKSWGKRIGIGLLVLLGFVAGPYLNDQIRNFTNQPEKLGAKRPQQQQVMPVQVRNWAVAYSPKGGCTDLVTSVLAEAKKSVYVQAYSFTSPTIAQALVDAKKRGVHVEIILDKGSATTHDSQAPFVARERVPLFIDGKHTIAHNKVMVIDEQLVITGSFNFTVAAEEHNAENCLLIHDPDLAARYLINWHAHRDHSTAYAP